MLKFHKLEKEVLTEDIFTFRVLISSRSSKPIAWKQLRRPTSVSRRDSLRAQWGNFFVSGPTFQRRSKTRLGASQVHIFEGDHIDLKPKSANHSDFCFLSCPECGYFVHHPKVKMTCGLCKPMGSCYPLMGILSYPHFCPSWLVVYYTVETVDSLMVRTVNCV